MIIIIVFYYFTTEEVDDEISRVSYLQMHHFFRVFII